MSNTISERRLAVAAGETATIGHQKCKCGHLLEEHDITYRCIKCDCSEFE